MRFDVHIQNAVINANRMIGILRHTFTFLDKDTFLQLYTAFILPHVEYDNAIWYPYLNRKSAAIERVQQWATKLVLKIKDMPYTGRLRALSLISLKLEE